MIHPRKLAILLGAILLGVVLPACGGGGSGAPAIPVYIPTPYVPPPSFPSQTPPAEYDPESFPFYVPSAAETARARGFETQEFLGVYESVSVGFFFNSTTTITTAALDKINAQWAYARGATGTGQTVLVVDSGIADTHREFSDGRVTIGETFLQTSTPYNPSGLQLRHGTQVAGIIAARKGQGGVANDGDMHGVAFDANIYFAAISLGTSDGIYRPYDLSSRTEADDMADAAFYERFLQLAGTGRAAIINQSFGVQGVISQYNAPTVRERFRHTIATLAQSTTRDADKKIIVWAAGNDQGQTLPGGGPAPFDSPSIDSGLGVVAPELRSHLVAVVALDGSEIASYSNYCGQAKSYCIAAPGTDILAPRFDNSPRYTGCRQRINFCTSGTSFAAPIVSGALAVMRQHFRDQLGNTQLVTRLFASADKSGIYANSDIYGQGVVDLDKATRPMGRLSVAVGPDLDGPSRPLFGSELRSIRSVSGDALARAFADRELVAFDELESPFFLAADRWMTGEGPEAAAHPSLPPVGVEQSQRRFRMGHGELLVRFDGDGNGEDQIAQAVYRLSGGKGDLFLAMNGQPGRLFGPYRGGDSSARSLDRRMLHSAPHLRFLEDGVGIGGGMSFTDGSRLAYGAFRGGALRETCGRIG